MIVTQVIASKMMNMCSQPVRRDKSPPSEWVERLVLGWAAVLAVVLPAGALAGEMHWCPGNRFTDALSPVQARELGCRPAAAGRVSQVQPLQPSPPIASRTEDAAASLAPISPPASVGADQAVAPTTQPSPPPSAAAARPADTARSVSAPVQAARDRDARQILEAELHRTRVAQQSLVSSAGAVDPQRLHRLRQDEAALQRELARFGP